MPSAYGPLPLTEVLNNPNLQLVCPHFQRRFKWGKSHFQSLWDDLDAILDESSEALFLGAFILKQPEGSAFGPKTSLIIDGQQRLTTIQLLIAAASWLARENHFERLAQKYGGFLLLDHREIAGQPRFVPTQFDRAQFNKILRSLKIDGANIPFDESEPTRGTILTAFDENLKMLETRASAHGNIEQFLEHFIDKLLNAINVIYVEIDDRFQVNEVFDRLNRTGAPLSLADLARNEVFRRFGANYNSPIAVSVYNDIWRPFESSVGKEYIDKLFFPYALIKDSNTTQAKAFSKLSSYWAGELKARDGDESDAKAFAQLVVEDLNYFKPSFVAITQGIRPEGISDELWGVIRSLYLMPAPTAIYPFVLKLLSDYLAGKFTEEYTHDALKLCESFLVRRAFQGLEPTGLHAVFKRAFSESCAKDQSLESVAESFTSSTITFPTDEEFVKSIGTFGLYGRRISKYVLLEYERYCRKYEDLDEKLFTDKNVTIDHVMPQSISGEWLTTFGKGMKHSKYVNTWANLVLLSRKLNSLKSTASYKAAKILVADENIFTSTKQFFSRNNSWTETEMNKRSKLLEDFALTRWPKESLLR